MSGSLLSPAAGGRAPGLIAGCVLSALLLGVPALTRADAFDRTWCEIDAGDFTFITDHPRDEAEALVRLMHTFRPVAETYLAGTPNPRNPPLTVIVFRRAGDFRRALDGAQLVGFMLPSFTENLMVVGPDPNTQRDAESLLHEYVHYLLRTRTDINIPTWYDEGLAGMLASAHVDDGDVIVGDMPVRLLQTTIERANMSLDDVLGAEDLWDWPHHRIRGFYDYSRVLVHRLLLGQVRGRDDLRPALARYLTGDGDALTEALDVSARSFDRRLARYLERGGATMATPAPPTPSTALPYRCLNASETVRRLALAIVLHNPEDAARHLRRQVAAEPDNAGLWTALSLAEEGLEDRDAALAAARRALALAPEDGDAAARLAAALAMGCILEVSEDCRSRWQEAVPLLRQALRRDPTHQDAIFILGLAYLYSGRPGDALNYLRIAHNRQPWAPAVNFYLGESYRLIGDSRARTYLERAKRWSATELWRRLAEAGLELLDPTATPAEPAPAPGERAGGEASAGVSG